ncbi:carboxymuconolactone decarboxylase family protein [Candidatus Binatus sp.]|uniref:carboxymuconolactone decarboxylase family protein n=1 Tax=Candidatus Binatus sp. TaxID=2811406 RepID=UPI003BB1263F
MAHVKHDWRGAPLSDADRAMLAYAEKITANPSSMTLDDLNGLRAHFSEEQTLDIVVIASLFNFIDRIADGLGVELDSALKQMAASSPDGEALTEVAAPMRAQSKT